MLVGFHRDDTVKDSDYIISKINGLRIFNDTEGMMNLPVTDTAGEILVVSQFTLYGDARKGKRPSYSDSMQPDKALLFYESFIESFKKFNARVKSVKFGADMDVSLVNHGPVTILLDSSKNF